MQNPNLEELFNKYNISDKKKKEIDLLINKFVVKNTTAGLKAVLWLIAANIVLLLINALFVRSLGFAFVGGFTNGIFIGSYLIRNIKQLRDDLNNDVKKVIEREDNEDQQK